MNSMTGYGAVEGKVGRGQLFLEVKSVNHRFCEINVKHPPKMGVLESKIKKYLEIKYLRGKIDVFIKETQPVFGELDLVADLSLARKYQKALRQVNQALNLKGSDNILDYIGLDKFVSVQEKTGNYEQVWNQTKKLLDAACKHVDRMRIREGIYIRVDQQKRINKVKKIVAKIRQEANSSLEKNKERVRKRVNNIGQLDEQRFLTEVAYLGSRQDITEEVIRLESHINQYNKLITQNEAVGRRLDFLLQEVNREINTIGSKASHVVISRLVVDCKSELERLREQVQNIE
ncbi:MAG: YicC/YloC family endoribonuclease [Pseudomonadota bacterium]